MFVRGTARHDLVNEISVATEAGLLQHPRITGLYHDRFVKVLEREALGVMVTVHRFGDELLERRVRQVTVRTGCHDVMTGFDP